MRAMWNSGGPVRLLWTRAGSTLVGLLLLGAVAGGGIAFAAADRALAPTPVITITNFTFQGDLTVQPGAMITVHNADTVTHTLTAVDGSFTTPQIPGGQSVTLAAPTKVGRYAIRCKIHASMSGAIVVSAAAPPSASADPSPSASPAPPLHPVVTITNSTYGGDLTVLAGTVVTVRNTDSIPHSFTAVNATFSTPIIAPRGSATFTAPAVAGRYLIKCNVHSFMAGTLTVVAAAHQH